jgi:hypothetical protein
LFLLFYDMIWIWWVDSNSFALPLFLLPVSVHPNCWILIVDSCYLDCHSHQQILSILFAGLQRSSGTISICTFRTTLLVSSI